MSPRNETCKVARSPIALATHNAVKVMTVAACALAMALPAYAARPENPGNPGGGKPDNPGGGGGKPDEPGRGKGGLYADLLLVYRSVDGLPLFVEVPVNSPPTASANAGGGNGGNPNITAEPPPGDSVGCLQPLTPYVDDPVVDAWAATVGLTNPLLNPAYGGDGPQMSPIPLGGTGAEGEECDVNTAYTSYTRETQFGRLNLGRSPTKVLSQQLRDVVGVLSAADELSLDEAGRLAADGVEVDSPGQNLAIHAELQTETLLTAQDQTAIVLPVPPIAGYGYLDHAAAALGAAADKTGLIDVDLVVYNNRILGIPDQTVAATITGDGTVGEAGEKYVSYAAYGYARSGKYTGCFEGLDTSTVPATYIAGYLIDLVFGGEDFSSTNVYAFAQNADDSRAVINYVHGNITYNVDRVGERAVCDALGI